MSPRFQDLVMRQTQHLWTDLLAAAMVTSGMLVGVLAILK